MRPWLWPLAALLPMLLAACQTTVDPLATSTGTPTMNPDPTTAASAAEPADPNLWLEDVEGERALAWVRERNALTRARLEAFPRFETIRRDIRAILDSKQQIPQIARRGDALYNFWRDADHPRGLWRRTTLASYRLAEPVWETVLDLDALARSENENWVWAGAVCLGPDHRHCLIQLSRGGADAVVVREFDSVQRQFVDGGFTLPEAKTDVTWLDADTLYVGTDFGPGSLTDSGYPHITKRWKRGQALADAAVVFEGKTSDVAASVGVHRERGRRTIIAARAIDFYRSEQFLLHEDGSAAPRLERIAIPGDASIDLWDDRALIRLRTDWTVAGRTWPGGSLLVTPLAALRAGQPELQALFTPSATRSLSGWSATASRLLLQVMDNVADRLEAWTPGATPAAPWQGRAVTTPFPGTLGVQALHDPELADDPLAERYLLSYTDFLTPDTLQLGDASDPADRLEPLKARPAFFDAAGMRVDQRFATSADGTKVPYFIVWPKGATADGLSPTLLYGYGGFEVSQQPFYSGGFGKAWYGQGGVLVVANIRGGGEYGPAWHQAAVGANKQKSYDDFIAVARDLIATRVTSPKHLGIMGGSNGGLLVGAVLLQAPELFNAVVCQVPLLDMRRYHQLLAGASWMAEYGNPDVPEEWAAIARYSPYQNVRADQKLPATLFITSTRDDRVHPGHARKMAARMLQQGHAPLYYENIEGGHGGAADHAQMADMQALEFSFLWQQLGPAPRR